VHSETETDYSIVGISFGVSLPFIFLAFNIRWVTTPWNYLRHIGIKVLLIILLRPLRNSKSWRVWSKAQLWTIKLYLSVTEHEFTSQPDQAWGMQSVRAMMPVSMKSISMKKLVTRTSFPALMKIQIQTPKIRRMKIWRKRRLCLNTWEEFTRSLEGES